MNRLQTDNSYILEKIMLREHALSCLKKKEINILDAFCGNGLLWNLIIKKRPEYQINILSIDKKKKTSKLHLIGDNIKFLKTINLEHYDIIDLDAYGIPLEQMEVLFERKYNGIIICTFCSTYYGTLPNKILEMAGFSRKMIMKAPTLFSKNRMEVLLNYLYKNNVPEIVCYERKNKAYFYFKTP